MNDKGRIALSSLAVSTSVAAILGISGAAYADPPSGYCNVGPACSLGWTQDFGTWTADQTEGQLADGNWVPIEGGQGQGYIEGGHMDYGTCGFDTGSPPACGCGGWRHTEMYQGEPFSYSLQMGDGNPYYQLWAPTNWDPPFFGVNWTPVGVYSEPVFYPVGTGPTGYECWISD
jgi:hypothetical protein